MERHPVPKRIRNLALPERQLTLGQSLRESERELEAVQFGGDLLDLTYANTHRFPPPSWVLPDFVAAASGGGRTYTPYRGDQVVRSAVAASVSAFLKIEIDPAPELLPPPGSQADTFVAM